MLSFTPLSAIVIHLSKALYHHLPLYLAGLQLGPAGSPRSRISLGYLPVPDPELELESDDCYSIGAHAGRFPRVYSTRQRASYTA